MIANDTVIDIGTKKMAYSIFCPSSHLMLSSPACPVCGWQNKADGEMGEAAWTPRQYPEGFGVSKPDTFIRPAVFNGVAAFPLRNHEIIGIETGTGKERWRLQLGFEQVIKQVVTDQDRFLISISDGRPFGTAGQSRLSSIDAETGEITELWNDAGHQISAPVLTRDYILIRTISSLAALSRTSKPDLIWRLPLQTWFDLPPIASDDQAFIFDGNTVKNFGQILAVKLSNSSITWHSETDGITMQPAALTNEAIIFQNGKHQISALDFIDGHTQWTADFDKIYTPPMITNQSALCVSREQADDGNSTHYSLNALDTATGIPLWQSPLPARVRIPPAVNGENIFLATSDGRLLAIDSASHEKVFEKSIGTELDPPAAELMIDDGILYSCSSSGMLSAIRVETANPARLLPPEDYLKSNNFELAAAAYALQGDFKNAAAIFANRLQDIKKALVLYDAAGMYDEAASISSQHGFLAEAEYYYQLAGDPLNQAKMLLKRSDDAPNKAVYAGQLRRAVELLNKVGQDDRELDTLVKLSEIKPEKVLFERIIKLARICARYGDEAAAWEKINNPVNAADAYRRAGVLAEQEKPQNKNVIVGYFKKAAQLFSECGKDSDSYQCQNEIAMLEELPIINIKIKQLIELKEGKWSIIGLVLQNIGYGIAQQISWHILPGRFEFETAAGIWNYKSLGIGSEKEVQINIRPNIGEAGDAVPMIIEWQWINLDGKRIQHRTSVSLNVMAQKSIVKTGSAMTRANDLSKTYKARMKRLGRNIK